ncbi:MAG: isoamylase, partial [Gaiellales bacterium]|nr:isoamylase [Gaiellales bacterium]
DLYGDGRRPFASINFVTAHDGFSLRDLVSYNEKHNEANLEGNRDGADDNRSWNCGVEGPTDDPEILELRARQQRNLLATLVLSQGVPMLLGGDELGRTQGGNNNAWCQDNEISWYDWQHIDHELLAFTRRLVHLRREQPVFRRRDFLVGSDQRSGLPDVVWLRSDGVKLEGDDWKREDWRSLAVFLNGEEIPSHSRRGAPIRGDSFLLAINSHHDGVAFTMPDRRFGERWVVELSTDGQEAGILAPGEQLILPAYALAVLRRED